MNAKLVLAISSLLFLALSTEVILGEGLSGGRLLSLVLFWRDIKEARLDVVFRLSAWLTLLGPSCGIVAGLIGMIASRGGGKHAQRP